jgi:hypothetical protein
VTPCPRPILLPLLLAIGACTERITAPGACPDFCPRDSIRLEDVILDSIIVRDSAYAGYLQGYQGEALAVADLPGVDSRAIFLMNRFTEVMPDSGDTTRGPGIVDSSWVRVHIARRDTNTANLRLKLYRLPITIDSTTTFDSVAAEFGAPPLDSLNVDSLLARPDVVDSLTVATWGDTIRTDGAGHVLQFSPADSTLILYFRLDTLQAPFSVADSGKLAFGVRVAADSLASIALGANERLDGATMRRFYHYTKMIDSTTDSTVSTSLLRGATFDNFVFDPPTPALDAGAVDSTLVVGGVPAVRSLVRVRIPAFLRDTTDVVRATLLLVPAGPVPGAAGDSFTVVVRPVVTDIGPKSPLSGSAGRATVHIGSADTVRIEVTDVIRAWARDTTAATAFVLGQIPEAARYTQIRFYSSRATARRPTVHVTYVRRFPFGGGTP